MKKKEKYPDKEKLHKRFEEETKKHERFVKAYKGEL